MGISSRASRIDFVNGRPADRVDSMAGGQAGRVQSKSNILKDGLCILCLVEPDEVWHMGEWRRGQPISNSGWNDDS